MRRLAVLALVVAPARAGAEPCRHAVLLTGERDLVASIEPIVRARGIDVVAADAVDPQCRPIKAEVVRGGGRVMVWIIDVDERRIERLTEDPEGAATAIESWTRGDLLDPLLATRRVPDSSWDATPAAEPARDDSAHRFTLSAGADTGVSDDGAVWTGARVQGCALIGSVCIGGLVRYSIDLEKTGDAAARGDGRTALEVTLAGERPLHRRTLTVTPNLGVGLVAVTASGVDPSDGQREVMQASALHVRAGCGFAVRVTRNWSIRTDLSIAVAPLAERELGDTKVDPITMEPDKALAGSSIVQGWLGVALAFGGL